MLNRHICYMMAFCEAGFLPKQNQVSSGETGFSLLIRNSFWTACYYLWPLDVWIDLQALGPGHCVGHVWRRSWPLCVRQGPQISCTPPKKHTHTHTHTNTHIHTHSDCPHPNPPAPPITSTLWTKAYRTLMFCRILGITEQTCALDPGRCKKLFHNSRHKLVCPHSAHISSIWNMSIQIQYRPNNKRYSQLNLSLQGLQRWPCFRQFN